MPSSHLTFCLILCNGIFSSYRFVVSEKNLPAVLGVCSAVERWIKPSLASRGDNGRAFGRGKGGTMERIL